MATFIKLTQASIHRSELAEDAWVNVDLIERFGPTTIAGGFAGSFVSFDEASVDGIMYVRQTPQQILELIRAAIANATGVATVATDISILSNKGEATARLIAAAPDLLAAAQRVVAKLQHPTASVTYFDQEALQLAIAKATGEA